jgi:hypothetical protein
MLFFPFGNSSRMLGELLFKVSVLISKFKFFLLFLIDGLEALDSLKPQLIFML